VSDAKITNSHRIGQSLFALSDAEALAFAEGRITPCFAYRLDAARERFLELRAAFPERAVLAYAVKANPGLPLVKAFADLGAWLDCASLGELELAREVPLPGSRLLFAGPGKSQVELALALSMGARIQADGIEDIARLSALLEVGGPPLSVSLRVHPASGVTEGSRIIGGSGPSAFGVDEEGLESFLREASGFERVHITGLQVFAASNEKSAQRLLANYGVAFAIGKALQRASGSPLELIDLGGGLGIPYAEDEEELDIEALGSGLAALLDRNGWFRGRVVVEPGRWLSGPIGVYLARVLRVKESRGTRFAILEGGINHLLRPRLTGQGFPSCVLRSAEDAPGELLSYTLAGPLCTSLDRLGEARLPPLKPGDLVMFGQAGAYGATEAMTRFLLHPEAGEYWLNERRDIP